MYKILLQILPVNQEIERESLDCVTWWDLLFERHGSDWTLFIASEVSYEVEKMESLRLILSEERLEISSSDVIEELSAPLLSLLVG